MFIAPAFVLPCIIIQLSNKWDILGPEFDHDGRAFSMDFTVRDQLPEQQILYTLYDGEGCKHGGKGKGPAHELPKDNKYIHSSMVIKSSNDDGETEHAMISFEVESGAVSGSSMYKIIDENHAELVLCVRFGVYTGPPSEADSVEVNFRETVFKLRATLDQGFDIQGLESSL